MVQAKLMGVKCNANVHCQTPKKKLQLLIPSLDLEIFQLKSADMQ
jgi:hypothetical protein